MKYLKLLFCIFIFALIFSTCDRSPIIVEEEFPEHHYRNKFLGTWVDYYSRGTYIGDSISHDNNGWYHYITIYEYTNDGKLYYKRLFFLGDSLLSYDLTNDQFFLLDTLGVVNYSVNKDTIFEYCYMSSYNRPVVAKYKYLFTSDSSLILYWHSSYEYIEAVKHDYLTKIE